MRELARWESLTDRFALVLQRLRSAWLVGWFGPAAPVDGVDILVSIANLDQLQRRWAAVGRGRRAEPGVLGPNLTEPLLGMSGALVGALAAPFNSLLLLVVLDHVVGSVFGKILIMLGWLSGGALVSAVLGIAAPVVGFGLVPGAIGGQASDMFDVLGGVALLARPLARLWAQLTGREPVGTDRLAALVAQLLGAIAVVVTRFAGLLAPTRDAVIATILAVTEIGAAIGLVITDTVDAVTSLFDGPGSMPAVLAAVQQAVARLFGRILVLLTEGLTALATRLTHRLAGVLPTLAHWVVRAVGYLRTVLLDDPVIRWFLAFRELAAGLSAWSRRRAATPPAAGPPPSSPPSPWLTSFPWPASARALATVARHRPPAPSLGPIPPVPLLGPEAVPPLARAAEEGLLPAGPDPFALDQRHRAAIGRFRRPPSVFAGMWAELASKERERGSVGQLLGLADAISRITPFVTRSAALVVPQAAGEFLPRLESLLARIDQEIRSDAVPRPTRDLAEPSTVAPVVGRLVIRGDAAPSARPAVEAFAGALRGALAASPYPVPAGG